jgi:two-component system, OmpR family, sensor histidine kinase KdpD
MIPVRLKMPAHFDSRTSLRWSMATLSPIAATFVLVVSGANSTTAGLVLLVLVVWSATQAKFGRSLYIAGLCALGFDYYFLPPYRTLCLEGAQDWVAMLAFAACCLVASQAAEHARRQTRQAEQRQGEVERLYALSQELMLHGEAEGLIRDLPTLIGRVFLLEDVVLYVRDQDRFYGSASEAPRNVEAEMRAMMQEPGTGLSPAMALDSGYQGTELMLGLRSVGALAWRPETLTREVSAAVCAQAAIVVARSMAIEVSTRMEAARESERLRAALVDSLTHELRTPLTSIRAASTTLLEAEGLDEAGRLEMARIIDEESGRLDVLIGEAVEMAEIDAKVVNVHLAPQLPRVLLEQAVEESRQALAGRRVSIAVEEAEKPAWFDPDLLGRVLRHLLENAAGYTPPGSRVTLSSRRIGDRLEFCVEDNGPGIDALDLPLIFEKFYRGRRGAAARKGSGMGLAIARAILTAHGGGIEASNAPGAGARFRFWTPLVEKEPERAPENSTMAGKSTP